MPEQLARRDLEEARSGVFRRAFHMDRGAVDKQTRTIELAFSSEEPYERWWGIEILDHSESSVRLGRLNDGAHPLLVNHDWDRQPGVIEKAWIGDDRRGRSTARFGRSAFAEEILQDVEDGIRSLVSVGYLVHKVIEQSTSKGAEPSERVLTGDEFRTLVQSDEFQRSLGDRRAAGDDPPVYRVVDWEPFENSIVAIPADATVGVGRSFNGVKAPPPEELKMPEVNNQPAASVPDVQAITNAAREAEIARSREILALGNLHSRQDMAQKAVADGTSLEQFRSDLLADLAAKQAKPSAEIGLTDREARRFSFVRLIEAICREKMQNGNAAQLAPFEMEVVRAAAGQHDSNRQTRGVRIPVDVLKRDLTVGTTSAGGYTVATDLLGGSFIDVLRNAMAMQQLGATFLTGLVGNIAIPRKTAGATSYWVGENTAPTEGALTFDQVTMSPKTVAAFVDYSRKLTLQASLDVESMVRNDLAASIALALDLAAFAGSGAANQPTGVLSVSGIGDVEGGTNGLAPTWAHIVELESDIAVANAAIGSMAYYTNAKVRGKLKTTSKVSGQNGFVWDAGAEPLNGYRAIVSNQVPSNLTKGTAAGVCSAIAFGNWADLLIGLWSGIDLLVDPYTGSSAGTVRVTAFQDADIAVRHAESFSVMKDALTV